MLTLLFLLALSGFSIKNAHAGCHSLTHESIFEVNLGKDECNSCSKPKDCGSCSSEHCEASGSGPGYCSPEAAIKNHKREKILYVPAISLTPENPDYLTAIDVDRSSPTYSQVITRMFFTEQEVKDELHHFGWNTCSACHHDKTAIRNKPIFPCLGSDRIYIVDTSDAINPKLYKTIESDELHALGLSSPHTTHCISTGEIMISTMGDGPDGNAKGQFLMLDGKKNFTLKGTFSNHDSSFGYDFWYHIKFNVLVSTEWGAPNHFKKE